MGLFSFIKEKGAKLFGKKNEEVPASSASTTAPAEVEKQIEVSKIDSLRAEVDRLGLCVDELHIEIAEQVIVTGKTDTSAIREKVILALGNVEGVASVDDRIEVANPAPEAVFYTVQSGDSLSKIAKAHYGDPMKYPDIFEANKPMLTHPDKIYPGQVLRIPA